MKITKSQLKELIRNSIRSVVSEQETVKFKDPETGKEHEITMDTVKRYQSDIKAGDKSKEKVAAVKAANLDKDVSGDKEKPEPTKTTKISADPFTDKDEPEGDVGGPSYPNVPKGVKTSKQAKSKQKIMKDIEKRGQIGDFIDKYDHLLPIKDSATLVSAYIQGKIEKADKIMKDIEKRGQAGEFDNPDPDSVYNWPKKGDKDHPLNQPKDISGDKPKQKSRPKAMDDLDWDDEIEPHELEGWIQDNQKNIPNSSMKAIDGWMDDYEEYWSNEQYKHASAVQYKIQKELENYLRESVNESKQRRFTVKEVRMWMKKLEENRYKKVYNSDARRVAWMVNNEGVELSEMPKSMSKKWTKAQYGRERYLANEFIKSKSEQMNEGKLTETKFYAFFNKKKHTIDGKSLYDAKQKAITKLKVPKSKVGMLSIVNAKEHDRGGFRFEQKLRGLIRQIIKEQLNEAKFKKIILPNDRKSQTITSKIIKKMSLRYQKDYNMLAHGSGPLKAKGGNQVIMILPKHYNKFIELAMQNKLNVRG